jgi:hypothetical protein
MSTLKTTNLQHASAASPAIVLASDGTATAQLSSLNGGPLAGSRNRIINGEMRIDQRNAGASVTTNSANRTYGVDRWYGFGQASDGVFTIAQSTTAPAGFVNSTLITVTTADTSIGATQEYLFGQMVEGFNVSDLGFGSASAKAITLSFWIRSSVTGTFGGVLANSGRDRSYPFTFAINSANTWEQKTVTVAGDTTGTWATDNGTGFRVDFSLGAGSSYLASAGAWTTTAARGATGQTNLIGTNGATFYITGVQLEAGSVATPFERRSYGQELALCQRYYEKSYDMGTTPGTGTATGGWIVTSASSSSYEMIQYSQKRATPSVTVYSSFDGASGNVVEFATNTNKAATVDSIGETASRVRWTGNDGNRTGCHWVSSAEL